MNACGLSFGVRKLLLLLLFVRVSFHIGGGAVSAATPLCFLSNCANDVDDCCFDEDDDNDISLLIFRFLLFFLCFAFAVISVEDGPDVT